MKVTLSAKMIEALAYLGKNGLDAQPTYKLPKMTSMGEEIKTIKDLSAAMGVDKQVAAVYGLKSNVPELKADATEILMPGIYNAFEDGYEPVVHYAYSIAEKMISEEKSVRFVRDSSGAKYFSLPVGSIITADGKKPLDALSATRNDVPGYEKIVDKQGRAYYLGRENGIFVVRDGATKQVIYHTDAKNGVQSSLYWLNSYVGGQSQGKSMDENIEIKRQFTTLAVEKLGKRGHAFRNKDGSYSYPISTVADLKNAIQAFGRSAPEDRERLKAFIIKRAKQLNSESLIPENWETSEPDDNDADDKKKSAPMDLEVKRVHVDKPVSAMDTTPLGKPPKDNWVELAGQLPPYIRAIAHALIRDHGFTTSRAIATAISRIKMWIASPHTDAATKAKATKALAQWEALRAKSKARSAAKKG